jgi:hypothetical protein
LKLHFGSQKLGPPPTGWRTLAGMLQQRCEVCENFRPEGDLKPNRKLEEVRYGKRRVLLCLAHAGIAKNSGVTTLEGLRELYTEQHGSRSYVPRRARGATTTKSRPRSPGRRFGDQA